MKSTVEQLSPTRVKINVEVPFDELKPNFDKAYKKIAEQVRIPGFRPGKAPARVLESRIGRAPVLDEVVNEAIPAKYMEAVQANEVQTLGRPDFEVTNLDDKNILEFSASVDVRPTIELPSYDDISVIVSDVEVTEADVDEQLDELRARFGTLTGVDRPAQHGDFTSIDLAAAVDGEEVPDASTSGLSYEIGSGQLIDGIDDAIIGAAEGESRTFTSTLMAGKHAGQQAEVTVTVQSIKQRELPEADDEFAQMASEFDTIAELREDLQSRLSNMKKMQQGVDARDQILDKMLAATEVPVPEQSVEQEVENRRHDAVHEFDHDDDAFARYLETQGKTREQFDTEVREEAEKSVRTQLLLDSIADDEEVQVGEQELTERIVYQAQRYGVSPDEYIQRAQQSGQLGAIFADVRRGKALAQVVRRTTVTDESGNAVDLEELFGPQQDAEQPEVVEAEAVESAEAEEAGEAGESSPSEAAATDVPSVTGAAEAGAGEKQ